MVDWITVTGDWRRPYGGGNATPPTGSVTFALAEPIVDSDGQTIVSALAHTVQLQDGQIEVSLAATDSPGTQPAGNTYRVSWTVSDGRSTSTHKFSMELPHDGGPVDLAEVAPVEDASITYGATDPHGDGAHSEDYARGDGSLSVGQLAKIKTVSPLILEGIDSGTYRKDDRPAVLGAGEMDPVVNSPSLVIVGSRWLGYAYEDGTNNPFEGTAGVVDIPASWSTFDVVVWHTTLTGNAGDARVLVRMSAPAAGDDLAAHTIQSNLLVTAVSTAETLGVATIVTGVSDGPGRTLIELMRNGNAPGDDLTGDFVILHVELRKAS